jgi:tetratricopeptide (TPR) repeat protein
MLTDTQTLNAAAQKAASLLAVDPSGAEREAKRILAVSPRDPRALLVLGSARRRLGDPRGARAVLEPLAKAYPRAANTQYELGATFADLRQPAAAKATLRAAVSLNRDLAEAWRALGDLLFLEGDGAGAERAFAEHERALVQDPRLKPAAEALFNGDLAAAESRLRTHLMAQPDHAPALRMMAEVYVRLGRHGDAETLLAEALTRDPAHAGARFAYANALFQQQKGAQALAEAERLLAARPDDLSYLNLKAACLGIVGRTEDAVAIYQRLLKIYDKQPRLWLNHGHALRTLGRREEAVAAYKRCIALDPGLGDAYWSLANLKVVSFAPDDEQAMRTQVARPDLSADDRLHLHYALGKALEDRGDYAASFDHYAEGAALRRTQHPYDADETSRHTNRVMAAFTPAFFAERAGQGSSDEAPIFILGLPRAGSTLIEQILASHSMVEGTMELPDIGLIAKRLGRGDGASQAALQALSEHDADGLRALGEDYIRTTRIHRALGRPRFIDKMPNNFQHVGLIRAILPKAKIIDARRGPMASCFSAFKQHFAQGQSFSYDLTDLGRYYRDYVALMDHFDAVQPGTVHRVIYEEMVENTEAEVRRLLDYCGLPFEVGCLEFYANDRAVRTVSSEQVRRPIFRDALEQWRNYEPWLEPLKTALGTALTDWRGGPAAPHTA